MPRQPDVRRTCAGLGARLVSLRPELGCTASRTPVPPHHLLHPNINGAHLVAGPLSGYEDKQDCGMARIRILLTGATPTSLRIRPSLQAPQAQAPLWFHGNGETAASVRQQLSRTSRPAARRSSDRCPGDATGRGACNRCFTQKRDDPRRNRRRRFELLRPGSVARRRPAVIRVSGIALRAEPNCHPVSAPKV